MDNLARMPAAERSNYFEQAASNLGHLTPQLIEKDFWVCWVLERIFALESFGDYLTFKGGTSLSKVYNAIERFSEDIDLSIERTFLGFGEENEPEVGVSGKEVQRRIERLQTACQVAVADQLVPRLRSAITNELESHEGWSLTLDSNDPDSQSVLFHFPRAVAGLMSDYFAPSVKLELGARSDHFPVQQATVRAYVTDALGQVLPDTRISVRVLAGERTFWEKATILHAICHQPDEKLLPKRLSRHVYDLFQLADHAIGGQALNQPELLERVAIHKSVYFRSAWAKYHLARPKTLRLVPDEQRVKQLRIDYDSMRPMFFGTVPDFDEIIDRLRQLEATIHQLAKTNGE